MSLEYMLKMITVMAAVTYCIRMLPLLLIKKKIKNRFLCSFLYYVPFAVLSAMIIPDIFYSTSSIWSAAVGLIIAIVLSLADKKLLTVAIASCAAVYVVEFIIRFVQTGTMSF